MRSSARFSGRTLPAIGDWGEVKKLVVMERPADEQRHKKTRRKVFDYDLAHASFPWNMPFSCRVRNVKMSAQTRLQLTSISPSTSP
jgi:hypothetical protein